MSSRFFTPTLLILFVLSIGFPLQAQRSIRKSIPAVAMPQADSPKLVVGIVVDQMRYDYLTRFWDDFGDGGFKRMVNEGFNCKNNHFSYAPTYTGPGHASIYTGTTPAMHGIISNSWYDKNTKKPVYCAGDDNVEPIGSEGPEGQMSPHRMNVTTMTDQLRLHTQNNGKVISVALKDRGAVLPGGHMASAAYWFYGSAAGNWISSSFYMDKLPQWVLQYNASDAVEKYKKPWETLKNIGSYQESGPDNTAYESAFNGEAAPVFPHDLPAIWEANDSFELLKFTPYGNSITTDFALAALEGESLGQDDHTDFLAISFSSTDYIGHKFGANSKEVQDTYIWLDSDLERLFQALDQEVGVGAYTVFLTADHGAVHVPAYLADNNVPAGYASSAALRGELLKFFQFKYGNTALVENISNNQIFLDRAAVANLGIDLEDMQEAIAKEIIGYPSIFKVYTGSQMMSNAYVDGIPSILQNGFHQKRSGDVLFMFDPATISYPKTGSTHGSPLTYDTHVPLLFFGKGIRKGSTYERTRIADIAPTISALLGISFPSGTTGNPITWVLK
ncbi:MAG: alkaline phosphatase family protein [Eudoraea sp.]|nr:alkaline phosphatase family protein [Eudoraea sp.]